MECYNNAFLAAGCVRVGQGYPQDLLSFSPKEYEFLDTLNLV